MKELTLEATLDNLSEVLGFVDSFLEENYCSAKAQMQIDVAVEEIFVNIASYAYAPKTGNATIKLDRAEHSPIATIIPEDEGVPYDPLAKADPDITLSADERQIGGLGIYMVKKSMDSMEYQRADGKNILTLKKKI